MNFDFSHLYRKETVNLGVLGGHLLQVVVREVPHGEYVALQKDLIGEVHMSANKRDLENQMRSKKLDVTDFQDRKVLIAIESWTLRDNVGNDVPVCIEAWHALPHSLTEQIEKAVNSLNPDIDDEFQNEP